jgi:hypothetical protein
MFDLLKQAENDDHSNQDKQAVETRRCRWMFALFQAPQEDAQLVSHPAARRRG